MFIAKCSSFLLLQTDPGGSLSAVSLLMQFLASLRQEVGTNVSTALRLALPVAVGSVENTNPN